MGYMNTAPIPPSADEPRWLTAEEQRVWRSYIEAATLLEDHLDRQLQRDAGMPHVYYGLLVKLAESPRRRLRMTELARYAKITRSRLSHAIARLEKNGWVRREDCPPTSGASSPSSRTRGTRCCGGPRRATWTPYARPCSTVSRRNSRSPSARSCGSSPRDFSPASRCGPALAALSARPGQVRGDRAHGASPPPRTVWNG